MLNANVGVGCGSGPVGCGNSGECPFPPDFCIKRHDTRPDFRISMSDCDGPVDLSDDGIVVEASMWFDAKLKSSITSSSDQIMFADGIGFDAVRVGDVIATARARSPERMIVTAINESDRSMAVARGQDGTTAQAWDKGIGLRVFRFRDQPAMVESVSEDVESVDGTVSEELSDTLLVFKWDGAHTSMPGCYWLEFKILKVVPGGVDWVKRVPLDRDGFMINVIDSPTSPA